MEGLVKIAEINGESVDSTNKIAEILENAGFVIARCEGYEENVLVIKQMKSRFHSMEEINNDR